MEMKKKKKRTTTSVLQYKLAYERYYEPVTIKHCENYLRLPSYKVVAEPCGFVINESSFVFRATPDGKVVMVGE